MGQIIRFPRPARACDEALGTFRCALVAGTRVATGRGWQPVERVVPGDMVLTAETGMREVHHVDRRTLTGGALVHVPQRALGNEGALLLLPDQPVLPQDGDVPIPAERLVGRAGIGRRVLHEPVETIALHFAKPCGVFANLGAVLTCPDAAARDRTPRSVPVPSRIVMLEAARLQAACAAVPSPNRA